MKSPLKSLLVLLVLLTGIVALSVLNSSAIRAADPNLLSNPSVEQVDPSVSTEPRYWNYWKEGSNNARFTYENTGRTGTRSMKIMTTQYTSGSARWSFDPLTVKASTKYTHTNYYQSNVGTKIIVKYVYANGTNSYVTLGTMPASTTWRQSSVTFTTPANTKQITVMHALEKVGYLTVDDISLTTPTTTPAPVPTPPTGLSQGLVSLTFDDAWRSIYIHALPLLTKYNMKSTQYVNTNPVKVAQANTTAPYPYMMPYHVKEFHNKGHEIGSHTVNHPNLTQVSAAELNYQLTESKKYLTQLTGVVPKNFASPYGAYNTTTLNAIMQHYRSNRSYNGAGVVTPAGLNIRNITTVNVYKTTPVSQIKAKIDEARTKKAWVVLVFHDIDPNPRTYGYTPTGLEEILKHLQATNTPVVTIDKGLDLLQAAR